MTTIDGPVVRPTNRTYQHRGSIHDDATARQLGFRGGTIAASTHLDAFPPVLVGTFGERWFVDGCLSLYFRHATTDGEPVRVRLDVDGDAAEADLVTPDGTLVAEGTATVGHHDRPSALHARDLRHEPDGLRIVAGLHAGQPIGPTTTRCALAPQLARVRDGLIVEPLDWYTGGSPWGGPIAAPSTALAMFTDVAAAVLLDLIGSAVGLWGAMELRHLGRPLRCDDELSVAGEVVALGQTPRTETLWYDLTASDDGGPVASARVLTRFAKASSPRYADDEPAAT